jgi:putative transposase
VPHPLVWKGADVQAVDMRNKLVRIYGQGHLHFVTFSCDRRQRLLGRVATLNLFVKVLGEVRKRYEFALVGFVVMPEHVHLLMGEPKKGNPSKVIQALKQSVAQAAEQE